MGGERTKFKKRRNEMNKSEEQIGDRRNKTEKFREAIIVGVKRQNDRNEKKK